MNILSLVTTGTHCVFLSEFLAHFEAETKRQTRDLFQLITGSSSGTLVAAALNQGVPARIIGEQFTQQASKIYRKHPFPLSLTGNWIKSPFDQTALRDLILALVGDQHAKSPVSELEGGLLIPVWDLNSHTHYELASAALLKTIHQNLYWNQIPLEKAILGNMATPGQFLPVEANGQKLIDPSLVVSPLSCLPRFLGRAGIQESPLNILSLRATCNIHRGGFQAPQEVAGPSTANCGVITRLKSAKVLLDHLPELISARASVEAIRQYKWGFQEYKLKLSRSTPAFCPHSPDEYFHAIKEAARTEFQNFLSVEDGECFRRFKI